MRSPEEFKRLQQSNRAAMGLAGTDAVVVRAVPLGVGGLGVGGLGDGILGSVLGAAGPIHAGSAFPAISYDWDPSSPTQSGPESTGSALSQWLTVHVFRPEFSYAGVRYAPGEGFSDLSGWARILAWALGVGATVGAAWVAYRAFGPRHRRANVRRRARYFVTGRTS